MNREVKEFIRELNKRGWFIDRLTGSGHIKIIYPPGGSYILPMTPSDRRWLLNAQGDIRKIEIEYGPYKKPEKLQETLYNGKRGLDYNKPEEQPMKLAVIETPIINSSQQIIPLERTSFMSMPNKNLMVSLLKKRRDELMDKLAPYTDIILELEQVAESIKSLTGEITTIGKHISSIKTDGEKIKDFMGEKPVTKTDRYKLKDVYKLIVDVIKAHNNEMAVSELSAWMQNIHGIQPTNTQTVATKLIQYIKIFNNTNQGKACLSLYPEKELNAKRVKEYTSIKFKEGFINVE